jgi:hypothetical protein
MAKLTTKTRNALPNSAFAGPGRSFPVNNRSHAANAKSRATQGVKRGTLSPSSAAKIRAKANRILGVKPDKDSAAGAAT